MENLQEIILVSSNAVHPGATRMQEETHCAANSCQQQFHDLARRRIERNRAAKHARCASVLRMK